MDFSWLTNLFNKDPMQGPMPQPTAQQQEPFMLRFVPSAPRNDTRTWNPDVPYEPPYFPSQAELSSIFNKGAQFKPRDDWTKVSDPLGRDSLLGNYMGQRPLI